MANLTVKQKNDIKELKSLISKSSIIVLICFLFAALFLIIGIIGEYLAVLFAEMKDRPIYIIEDKINF